MSQGNQVLLAGGSEGWRVEGFEPFADLHHRPGNWPRRPNPVWNAGLGDRPCHRVPDGARRQLHWVLGVAKSVHALPRGDSAISTSGSLGLWIAAALVGTLAVAGGDIISRRDRRVLGDHPPSFRASIDARGLEMSVAQLAAESPRLFPVRLRIALDGAQLTSLMATNGFRPVPLTPWGGAYSAIVSNSAGGVEVVILYKQGKRSSSLW